MKKQNGFIIPLVLMLISIAIVLVTSIYQKGSIFVPFMGIVTQRAQAKLLAISGVQVAMSQLARSSDFAKATSGKQVEGAKEGEKIKALSPEQEAKNLLTQLLPTLNQWQEYSLKKDIDGVDGTIKIALSCEEGKLNLNHMYDFVRGRFRGEGQSSGDWKKLMQFISKRIQKSMGISADLFESFEKFFKHRQYKVNDATELLTQDGFKQFARTIFYEPPIKKKDSERPLYLLDVFTVYGNGKLQPWFLSDSVRGLLEMKRVGLTDEKKKKEMIQELVKKFKPNMNIAQDWNTLFQPLYGIEFKRLFKGIEAFFESSFDPKIFSVVSYGVFGEVTQRVYAILERMRHVDKDKTWYDVKIRKFYWI